MDTPERGTQVAITTLFLQLKQPVLVIDLIRPECPLLNSAACQLLGNNADDMTAYADWYPVLQPLLCDQSRSDTQVLPFGHRVLSCERSLIEDQGEQVLVVFLSEPFTESGTVSALSDVLDGLGAYVYCKDRDSRYTYVNREVCELFGMEPAQILGCDDSCFFDEATMQKLVENSDSQVINRGDVLRVEEVNFIPEFNEFRTYLTVKKPLIDSAGHITGLFGISTDITAQKQIQQQLYDSERKLSTVLDNVGACIFIKDCDCRFTYINRKTEQVFGATADAVLGLTVLDLLGPEAGQALYQTDLQVFASGKPVEVLESFDTPGGTMYFRTEKIPISNAQGEIDGYIGLAMDMTEQVMLERQLMDANQALQLRVDEVTHLKDELHQQAIRDPLTQLYNRRYLDSQQPVLFSQASVRKELAVILIDVDHFKRVNDQLGHQVGDEVLQLLARTLEEGCRRSDVVCRYGGEEFLVVLPATRISDACIRAEQLRRRFEQVAQRQLPDDFNCTISLGVASYPDHGQTFDAVLSASDKALYAAKLAGRNQVRLSGLSGRTSMI